MICPRIWTDYLDVEHWIWHFKISALKKKSIIFQSSFKKKLIFHQCISDFICIPSADRQSEWVGGDLEDHLVPTPSWGGVPYIWSRSINSPSQNRRPVLSRKGFSHNFNHHAHKTRHYFKERPVLTALYSSWLHFIHLPWSVTTQSYRMRKKN